MRIDVADLLGKTLISIGQATEVTVPPAEPSLSWPRIIEVATPWGVAVKINAAAPLHPQWYPGLAASIVGQGGVLADPSNGSSIGQPIRSAAGFPLVYATAGGSYVGTPSVALGDQAFNSDAEALDYLARSAAPGVAGSRSGSFTPHDDLSSPSLSAWNSLTTDEEKGRYLNAYPQVARFLLNSGQMSHEDSTRYANASLGYK